MKSGASDPFADDEPEDEPERTAEVQTGEPQDEAAAHERTTTPDERATPADERATGETEGAAADEQATTADDRATAPLDLPYIYRRDKVKDERPDVHQLFVREETDERAREAERELETLLDGDVYRLDAREAIYLVGMRHLDEAATILREWGYDR